MILLKKSTALANTASERKQEVALDGDALRLWSAPNGRRDSTCMSDMVRLFYSYDEFWYSEI